MKAKRFLSLMLSLTLAVSLAAPAAAAQDPVEEMAGKYGLELPAETEALPVSGDLGWSLVTGETKEAGEVTWRTLDYMTFLEEQTRAFEEAHAGERDSFDADAWFAENWPGATKEEYMEIFEIADEDAFRQAMWEEYMQNQVGVLSWEAYEDRLMELYEAAFPGELDSLDTAVLLSYEGYYDPVTAYMNDNYLEDEAAVRGQLLVNYVTNRQQIANTHDRAEGYRTADPESWERFDADAYFAENYYWYDKEEFMHSWRGPFYTEEDLKEYLYVESMEKNDPFYPWNQYTGDATLVVNGVTDYDAQLTTADGVSYLPAGELNAILGASLTGEEPLAIRPAAEAAGWDVTWNRRNNQVVLLDKEKLTRGIILPGYEEGEQAEDADFVEYDLSRFEELLKRLLSAQKVEKGQSYRTTNRYDLTLTTLNSLDGDKDYKLNVKADVLARDGVMDLTLTANAAQLLELVPQAAMDKLSAQMGKVDFQNLKTLLTGCKLQVILDLEGGMAYWNLPLLTLADPTVTEDTWFSYDLGEMDLTALSEALTALREGEWSVGEFLYEMLLRDSADSYMGAEDSYESFMMIYGMANTFFGPHTMSENGGNLTWKLDTAMVNAAFSGLMDFMAWEDYEEEQESPAFELFKEYELTMTVDKNGRMTSSAAIRPNMEGLAAMATADSWYDAGETALMTWVMSLLDFRETAQSQGTADHATGTLEFHWKNQLKLKVDTVADQKPAKESPRTAPPAGAEIVEL